MRFSNYHFSLLLSICFSGLVGCQTTSTISSYTPASSCDDGECDPTPKTFRSEWGPISLSGGLSVLNFENIKALADAASNAIESSSYELALKVKQNLCGKNCDTHATLKSTQTVTLSSGLSSSGESNCGDPFTTTVTLTSTSPFGCSMASAGLISSAESALGDYDAICKEKGDSCSVGSISLEHNEGETAVNYTEAGKFPCTVTATANVTISCVNGNGSPASFDGLAVSGVEETTMECNKAISCNRDMIAQFEGELLSDAFLQKDL